MHGTAAAIVKMQKALGPKRVTLTPETAVALLERNNQNRPLRDHHAKMISARIKAGKWKYNGDTIKIDVDGNVLDGQHRLWAIVDSGISVDTVIVYGIERDAFATIDTDRKLRSGSDVIVLNGATRYSKLIASSLMWLVRYQRGEITTYRDPACKVTNADIEDAWNAHPEMLHAVEKAVVLRRLAPVSIMACLYYVLANRNMELAERMMRTLEDAEGINLSDPFFRLRNYFTADHHKKKDPIVTFATAIKAINYAADGQRVQSLNWRSHGKRAEAFPEMRV